MSNQMTVEDIENPNEKQEEVKQEKAPEKKEAVGEKQYVTLEELQKIQKQLNGLSYMGRKIDEMAKKWEQVSVSTQQQPHVNPADMDEEDKLIEQGKWKEAVDLRAEKRYQSLRQKEKEEDAKRQMEAKQLSILENSKKTVLEKYPQLNDESSEYAQKYRQIVINHPEFISNEFGPVLAMREMEEELRSEGKLDEGTKVVVDKELARRQRVGVASVPKSNPSGNSKPTLSKEEKEFCDYNGIKYDAYLTNRNRLSRDKQAEV